MKVHNIPNEQSKVFCSISNLSHPGLHKIFDRFFLRRIIITVICNTFGFYEEILN